jgi:hypothetical protein
LHRLAGIPTAFTGFPDASRGGLIERLDRDFGAGAIAFC